MLEILSDLVAGIFSDSIVVFALPAACAVIGCLVVLVGLAGLGWPATSAPGIALAVVGAIAGATLGHHGSKRLEGCAVSQFVVLLGIVGIAAALFTTYLSITG